MPAKYTTPPLDNKPKMTGSQWCSAALGCVATAAALYILTQDVVAGGALKSEHILLPALLLIGTVASKMSISAWRTGARLSAVGFALIGLFATTGVVLKSVGKQAEVRDGKVSAIRHTNKRINNLEDQLHAERKRLATAKRNVEWEIAGRPKSKINGVWVRDMLGKATGAKGCGSQCKTWQAQADAAESKVRELVREIAKLPAHRAADPEAEHWAKVLALFFAIDQRFFAEAFNLLTPINQTLVFELSAMLFFSYALHRSAPIYTPAPQPVQLRPVPQPANDVTLDPALEQDNVRRLRCVEAYNAEQRATGAPPSVRRVGQLAGVSKSAAQRYLADAREAGQVA